MQSIVALAREFLICSDRRRPGGPGSRATGEGQGLSPSSRQALQPALELKHAERLGRNGNAGGSVVNVHPCRSSSVPSGHQAMTPTVSWRNAPRHAVTHPPHRGSRHAVPHGCTPSSPCSWSSSWQIHVMLRRSEASRHLASSPATRWVIHL